MNAKRLDEKDPGEKVPLTFDFTPDLGTPEQTTTLIVGTPVITCTVDQSLRRGTDASASSMLVGSPQVSSGKIVLQMVEGGVHGVDYKVRCAVTINSTPSATLYKTSILPVRVQ